MIERSPVGRWQARGVGGVWIIDANNVIGSRPDGWWRDRPAALGRLMEEVAIWRAAVMDEVVVVVDGQPSAGVPEGSFGGIEVRYAHTSARDGADDEIVRIMAQDIDPTKVTVVTSDRGLVARVAARGAATEGAGAFLERLARVRPERPGS